MAGGPWALRIFGNPAMLFLGAASYSIYLIQSPVTSITSFIAARWPPLQWPPAVIIAVLVFTMAAGCLLYLLVERPARAWLRRVA